jgi:hypothetical protein
MDKVFLEQCPTHIKYLMVADSLRVNRTIGPQMILRYDCASVSPSECQHYP